MWLIQWRGGKFQVIVVQCWTLSFRKQRCDKCTNDAKLVAISWWALETKVSPNKQDVTKQRLDVKIYDEKPTHYLLKTQIPLILAKRFVIYLGNVHFVARIKCLIRNTILHGFCT
jgi:hypothetical protein